MINLVSLLVRDYDEAIDFFVRGLGFGLTTDQPSTTSSGTPKRWVVVTPPGIGTGLLLALADGEDQRRALGNQCGGRVGFFYQVDDFADAHARMSEYGVEFLEDPRTEPYGIVAVFVDVSGNKWDLIGPSTV